MTSRPEHAGGTVDAGGEQLELPTGPHVGDAATERDSGRTGDDQERRGGVAVPGVAVQDAHRVGRVGTDRDRSLELGDDIGPGARADDECCGGGCDQAAARAYREYAATLAAYQAVDFDDLIRLPVRILERDLEVRERWQRRLRLSLIHI